MKYFGGIEGGATHSRLVICKENGECAATTTGLGTNLWMVGIIECARRIADMIERAKIEIGISEDTPLISMGLSLSGCELESTNQELETELHKSFPNMSKKYVICSDTLGSLFTASPKGGLVVIAGTGSNTFLRNSDGSTYSCGGWGHLLGDEGSAWFIAHRAIKICFDDMDNLQKSPYPIDAVWNIIKDHFNVKTRLDLLPHCYANFNKSYFASLCKKLADIANSGDKIAREIFREAGVQIAQNIKAVLPNVKKDLIDESGYLKVVCVGSVWKSWPLLQDGFIMEMQKKVSHQFDLLLVTLTKHVAYGACYLAADCTDYTLPRKYDANYDILYKQNI